MSVPRLDHERLRRLRLDAGFSQEELATRIGVDVTTLRQYESGRVNAGPRGFDVRHVRRRNILHLLAQAFELPDDSTLLTYDEPPSPTVSAPPVELRPQIELASLPRTGPALFGRDVELATLDGALHDASTHVVCLVGWGGIGKSALVNRWLALQAKAGFPGLHGVFGWSFHAQGGVERQASSADLFLGAIAGWLGLEAVADQSVRDKARQIAAALRAGPALLVLDGVEALLDPQGELRCPGLQALLKQLAAQNPGLCVVTTRLPVADLDGWKGATVQDVAVGALPDAAGRELLADLGVSGEGAAIAETLRAYGGHPLTLQMVGRFLARSEGPFDRQAPLREVLPAIDRQGRVSELLAGYLEWLSDPARGLMLVLGLFDGPASPEALGAAIGDASRPLLPGLTDRLASPALRQAAVHELRALQLLSPRDPSDPGELDCHPLVREFFARRLRDHHPEAWALGHARLFEHFRDEAPELPRTLEAMGPVFLSVKHGIQGRRYADALLLSEQRINQGDFFAGNRLGAIGACIECLSLVFERPWVVLQPDLPPALATPVLAWAGRAFKAWGRGRESCQILQAAVERAEAEGLPSEVIADLELSLADAAVQIGQLPLAAQTARRCHGRYAGQPRGEGLLAATAASVILARCAARQGDLGPARDLIAELPALAPALAEAMATAPQGGLRILAQGAALQGAAILELLIALDQPAQALEWARLVDERLAQGPQALAPQPVIVGLIATQLGVASQRLGDDESARVHLDEALARLRTASFPGFVAQALLARAHQHLRDHEPEEASDCADEALEIAQSGGYRPIERGVAALRALQPSATLSR